MKLSVCLIVRDCEETVKLTLDSVKDFADEIVVVDTGSKDNTVEVVKSYPKVKLDHFEWIDDFSAARNYSFSLATGDWIMWLDAGDVIPPPQQVAFAHLKQSDALKEGSGVDVVCCELNRSIEPETGKVIFHYTVPRIVRRSANPRWEGAVHEMMLSDTTNAIYFAEGFVNDPEGFSKVATDRNITILERVIGEGDNKPRTLYYYANELRDHGRYEEAITAYQNFLQRMAETQAFTWEYYEALLSMAKCHRPLNRNGDAASALLQAIYYNSTRAEAFVMMGDLYYDEGKWAQALPFYLAVLGMKQPIDGSPVLDIAYTYLPYERIGFCQMGLSNFKEAVNAFHEAVKVAPDDLKDKFKEMAKRMRASIKQQQAQ